VSDSDPFDGAYERQPWIPHVYIMLCVLNERLTRMIEPLRRRRPGEPEWMSEVRRDPLSTMTDERLGSAAALVGGCGFVKVGSTYSDNPSLRPQKLASAAAPTTTMTCLGLSVVGQRVLCYVPGEESVERALHARWRADRIDPEREFFWINDEMLELIAAYKGYDPMGSDDPWDRAADRYTWWGVSK
jgi:hypothetical protein